MNEGTRSGKSTIRLLGISAERPTNGLYLFLPYIHVTVHRNKFIFNNQPDALIIQLYFVIKLVMFGHLLYPSSGVFYCLFGTDKFHAGLITASTQSQDGTTVPS
jgi:hypothetical protein